MIITLCLVSGGATAAWFAVATTALCFVLARRSVRVKALQDVRRQLVSEAMQSNELHNREVAEHLHDGPLQTFLAARLELDEVRERSPDPALDMVHAALQETAKGSRSTVTELHPQVLAQLGLTSAVRDRLRQFETRTDQVEAELDDVGKPESQSLLYRAARELLTNVSTHAKAATTAKVGLSRRRDRIVLTIADDGTGFDPAVVSQFVADGHIGLGSLLARFDAMGGAMDINSRTGHGTQVTVTSLRSRLPLPESWAHTQVRGTGPNFARRRGLLRLAQLNRETARDDQSLNLVGALEDLGDLGFTHVALDAIVAV